MCRIVRAYEGGVSIDYLEKQTLTKIIRLNNYANIINAEVKNELGN